MKVGGVIALMVVFLSASISSAYPGEIAIIVNKENPVSEMSFKELVKVFRQEKQYWEGGRKIYLIVQESGTPEKAIVMKKIFNMDDQELKKYWLGKVFRQEIASFPKTLSSNESVKRFVSQVPNAIGVIDASLLDDRVKALRIDGKWPTDAGYTLTDR